MVMGFVQSIDDWAARCASDPRWVADCLHRLYRFGGQHPESTVLRHSLEVWWMCRALSPAQQLWALLHDAHEILSGEITREWKAHETAERQQNADSKLRKALGISRVHTFAIRMADIKHGAWELEQLNTFLAGGFSQDTLAKLYAFSWHDSPKKFVELFEKLKGQI